MLEEGEEGIDETEPPREVFVTYTRTSIVSTVLIKILRQQTLLAIITILVIYLMASYLGQSSDLELNDIIRNKASLPYINTTKIYRCKF